MNKGVITSAVLSAVFAVGLTGLATPARAEYPEKPVEMTVLFGGTAQTIGQLLADLMSKNMSQTGADGYNIVWNSNSISTGFHGGRLDFDYTAFQPIAKISVEVPAIAVRADAGWDSLADMAADIKERGTKLKVGASGKGSFTHLTTEAILASQGLSDMAVHVPYDQGRAPVELIAGRLDAAVQWPGQFISRRRGDGHHHVARSRSAGRYADGGGPGA